MHGTRAGVGIGLGPPPQIPLDVATPSRVTDIALGLGCVVSDFPTSHLPTLSLVAKECPSPLSK